MLLELPLRGKDIATDAEFSGGVCGNFAFGVKLRMTRKRWGVWRRLF